MANNFRLGRVTEDASTLLNEFNASIMFDKELFDQDVRGSIAHSKMLCEAGILTKEEQASIEKGMGSTWELHLKLANWSPGEGGRISGVAVKCVDIGRNTSGEGGPLARD